MRDLGATHTIPNLAALPGSGVAGQMVCVANVYYHWNTTFSAWQVVEDGDIYSVLAANYTNSTTTLSTLFTFNGVANAVYELDMLGIWQGAGTTAGLKLALVSPAGAVQQLLCKVSAVQSGVTAPTFLELGISGTAQSGPAAAVASVPYVFDGQGIVAIGATAGAVTVQAASLAAVALTVLKGSRLRYKRVA